MSSRWIMERSRSSRHSVPLMFSSAIPASRSWRLSSFSNSPNGSGSWQFMSTELFAPRGLRCSDIQAEERQHHRYGVGAPEGDFGVQSACVTAKHGLIGFAKVFQA